MKTLLMTKNPAAILTEMDERGTLRAFEPTLADLRMEIPDGFHHKDNLTHSIKVLDNAIQRETQPDLILRTAALFHDIGKPATRKLGTKKSVSFDGHEVVGANMIRKILVKHGYSKSEISAIHFLIEAHMRSHFFENSGWTDSAIRRLILDTKDQVTLDRLIVLFYSDVTSGNASRRNKVYTSLDNLVAEIVRVRKEDERKKLRPAVDGNEVMEALQIEPGRQLGAIMKFLNSDVGIKLSKDEALVEARKIFNSFS